jgi:hypothetical protein
MWLGSTFAASPIPHEHEQASAVHFISMPVVCLASQGRCQPVLWNRSLGAPPYSAMHCLQLERVRLHSFGRTRTISSDETATNRRPVSRHDGAHASEPSVGAMTLAQSEGEAEPPELLPSVACVFVLAQISAWGLDVWRPGVQGSPSLAILNNPGHTCINARTVERLLLGGYLAPSGDVLAVTDSGRCALRVRVDITRRMHVSGTI